MSPVSRRSRRVAVSLAFFVVFGTIVFEPSALAQRAADSRLRSAEKALNQARANERDAQDKASAQATDEALAAYNEAVESRVNFLADRLRTLEDAAKLENPTLDIDDPNAVFEPSSSPQLVEYRAVRAEYTTLARSLAPAAPVVQAETEPNGTAATANTLSFAGQSLALVSAAINPGGDVDFYTFTAPAGSRVWIETDTGGTQNPGATSRDTVIDLLAADGTTVIENDDDDGTGNGGDGTVETGLASIVGGRTLVTGGSYFIRVRAFSVSQIINPYRLLVVTTNVAATAEVEANNTAATANALVAGAGQTGLRSGSIGAAGDADYYSVTVAVGSVLYFNVDADPERDGTGTDLVVELRDPADMLLLSVDSSFTGSLSNPMAEGANFTIVTAGTYFLRVRHFSGAGTGTYHIMATAGDSNCVAVPVVTAETEPNDTSATANLLDLTSQPAAIGSGTINPGGDLDFYTFTAPAGSRIWIAMDTGGIQNPGASSRDTVIDLLAADGTTVIENDDDDGTGNGGDGTVETGLASIIGGRTLVTGGTYFLRVRAFNAVGIINPYLVFVSNTNVAATAEVEANGTAATANTIVTAGGGTGLRSGSIGVAGDVDYYSIVAEAGNRIYFNVDADPERDGTGTDLVLELRSPADALLLSIDSSITGSLANPAAEGANFTIATAGTYFLRVRHFSGTGTGTYHAFVAAGSGPCGGSCTITCPANVTQSNDPNQCGAVVNYPPPTTTGSCGTVTCSPPAGSFFPVGTTTVTCTPSTGSPCTFTVTIDDNQAPSITCPANITQANDANQCGAVVSYAPMASDNCPGVMVSCTPPSGSFYPVGTTSANCTATDTAGNTATCGFTVTVNDAQAPALTCPASVTTPANTTMGMTVGANVTFAAPTVTDNCPGAGAATCVPASGSFFPVGTTNVTCSATDAAGNTGTCGFTVTVTSGFTNCYVDDATGDTFSINTDPTSPLYRFWQYRVAASALILQGSAEYLVYVPGRSLAAYDHDSATVSMDANISFSSRSGTVRVVERTGNIQHVLRDRNVTNDPPCM